MSVAVGGREPVTLRSLVCHLADYATQVELEAGLTEME